MGGAVPLLPGRNPGRFCISVLGPGMYGETGPAWHTRSPALGRGEHCPPPAQVRSIMAARKNLPEGVFWLPM